MFTVHTVQCTVAWHLRVRTQRHGNLGRVTSDCRRWSLCAGSGQGVVYKPKSRPEGLPGSEQVVPSRRLYPSTGQTLPPRPRVGGPITQHGRRRRAPAISDGDGAWQTHSHSPYPTPAAPRDRLAVHTHGSAVHVDRPCTPATATTRRQLRRPQRVRPRLRRHMWRRGGRTTEAGCRPPADGAETPQTAPVQYRKGAVPTNSKQTQLLVEEG